MAALGRVWLGELRVRGVGGWSVCGGRRSRTSGGGGRLQGFACGRHELSAGRVRRGGSTFSMNFASDSSSSTVTDMISNAI